MAHICHMPAHKNIETFNNVALQYIKKNIWSPLPWKDRKKFWNPKTMGGGGFRIHTLLMGLDVCQMWMCIPAQYK